MKNIAHEDKPEKEGFGELLKFTAPGFAGGLILGAVLDSFGFQKSGVGQWLVRTLSGEGESIFEGLYSIRQVFEVRKSQCQKLMHGASFYSYQYRGS